LRTFAASRRGAASVVNTLQVLANFEIGHRIVEYEQKGDKRAGYGTELLKALSVRLTEEFGKGFSRANLEYMRKFYLLWQTRVPQISQKASGKSMPAEICQQSAGKSTAEIAQAASGQLAPVEISAQPIRKSPFTLSWSHYVELLTIKDPGERSFYKIEATNENWSLPELRRQKASCLYERLALSRDKAGVRELLRPPREAAGRESHHRPPLVQRKEGCRCKAHAAGRCQHPRS
jgi:hypothetical protein